MVASIEKDVQAEFVKFNLGDKFNGFKMCMKSKMDLK